MGKYFCLSSDNTDLAAQTSTSTKFKTYSSSAEGPANVWKWVLNCWHWILRQFIRWNQFDHQLKISQHLPTGTQRQLNDHVHRLTDQAWLKGLLPPSSQTPRKLFWKMSKQQCMLHECWYCEWKELFIIITKIAMEQKMIKNCPVDCNYANDTVGKCLKLKLFIQWPSRERAIVIDK